jgi:cation transport regulator ChaB
MAKLNISHHERVAGGGHRWHVHLHGRSEPVEVELPDEERRRMDLSDEEIHTLLPTAFEKRMEENRDDELPSEPSHDVAFDAPVRVYQTHFMA